MRGAAALPDLNHRDPAYLELVQDTRLRLSRLYGTDRFLAYLLGGSGTAAMEAMATSCVREGPVLILANGYYSARLGDIFAVHGIPYRVMEWGWRESWDLEAIALELATHRYEAVLGTHHETTSGRLNPIADLGRLGRRHGVRVLVDAMSSFGADPIEFEHLDAVCSSANKCLHGIPGLAFVLVRDDLAEAMRGFPRHTYYLSLPLYEHDNPRLTPPVPALAALRQSLVEMEPGGQPARHRVYQSRASRIREAFAARALEFAVPLDQMSCTLTCASVPPGWTYERWHDAQRDAGFLTYGCKGELAGNFFQAANMGELSDAQIEAYSSWVLGSENH